MAEENKIIILPTTIPPKWEFSGSILHHTHLTKIAFLNARYKPSLNEHVRYSKPHLQYPKHYSTKPSIHLSILPIDLPPKQYQKELRHMSYSIAPNLPTGIY